MPLVYALALGIGLASAFSIPSGSSMLPNVVAPEQLQMANGMMMGMRVLTALAGPLLAGVLIAFSGHDAGAGAALADTRGLGIAFALDALTFAVTIWTLHHVQLHAGAVRAAPQRVLRRRRQRPGDGLARRRNAQRLPLLGRDFLRRRRHHAGGDAGAGQHPPRRRRRARPDDGRARAPAPGRHGPVCRSRATCASARSAPPCCWPTRIAGVLLMFMGGIDAAWQGAALMLALGALAGFMQVAVFTWIQRRVPREMLGRTMSIFMFILMGLAPLAASLTGLVMQHVTLAQLFVGAGLFLLAGALLAFALTPMRVMNDPKSATIPGSTPTA